jgi:ankyrin repeat protein
MFNTYAKDVKNIKTAIDSNIAWGIQVVINNGVNLQNIDIDGMNCLLYAIKKIRPQIISILLENNCTKYINQVDLSNNKNTPLIDAIKANSPEIVKILLNNNASIHKEDGYGWNAIQHAHCNGNYEIIDLIILHHKLICYAIKTNRPFELINQIIDNGVDINESDSVSNSTPLYFACAKNNKEVFDLLINKNVDVNKLSKSNVSPLDIAINCNNKYFVTTLIRLGANVNYINDFKSNCLTRACYNKNNEIIKILVQAGAKFTNRDKLFSNFLLKAIDDNNIDVAIHLINGGINLDARDDYDNNILMLACVNGNQELIEILLLHKWDLFHLNTFGENILSMTSDPLIINIIKENMIKSSNIKSNIYELCD